MLANASFSGSLSRSVAEFALEAAFLGDIAPNQGSAFSRIRFRFDLPAGHYRITHPYGVNTYDVTGSGTRTINDTVDTGCRQSVRSDDRRLRPHHPSCDGTAARRTATSATR